MTNEEFYKKYFQAVMESHHFINHDIAGRFHVIAFCLDEIKTHTKDEKIISLLTKIEQNLEVTTTLSKKLSLKKNGHSSDNAPKTLQEILDNVMVRIVNNFWRKSMTKIPKIECENSSLHIKGGLDLLSCAIYSINVIILDRFEFNGKINQNVKVTFSDRYLMITAPVSLGHESFKQYIASETRNFPYKKEFDLGLEVIEQRLSLTCESRENEITFKLDISDLI